MTMFVHHDLDALDRLLRRYAHDDTTADERGGIAVQIVEQMRMEQWSNELRCLRERVRSACPDPQHHTHAPDLDQL